MSQENPNAFKLWIDHKVVDAYARGLRKVNPQMKRETFVRLKTQLGPLELRDRVRLIADGLRDHLPDDYPQAVAMLREAVEQEDIKGFALWPAAEFVQIHGLDHFKESFEAMREWTVRFTAEFAVRPFIKRDPSRAFAELLRAAKDPNVHLRRWASEGSRPRLPWGERLHLLIHDPELTANILENLKFDPELYVRKSVCNHLNDIAKDHPQQVVETLARWSREVPPGFEKEFVWIQRQSLRTLVKNGDPAALKLLGVKHRDPALAIVRFTVSEKNVRIGKNLEFEVSVKNSGKTPRAYVLDYAVHYRKSNGTLSPKVFKLKSGTIPPGTVLRIRKKHSFRPVTTRRYYPGPHQISLVLNGVMAKPRMFDLQK